MEHEVFIPVPAETLREALRDHARVARCVPGLQQDADESARPLSGRLKVRVGGHTITYRGALTLTERAGAFTAKGEGAEIRGTGSAGLNVRIRLREAEGGTTVAFTATSTSEGRLSDIAPTTSEAAARRLLDRFATALGASGGEGEGGRAADEGGATASDTASPGAGGAAAGAGESDAAGGAAAGQGGDVAAAGGADGAGRASAGAGDSAETTPDDGAGDTAGSDAGDSAARASGASGDGGASRAGESDEAAGSDRDDAASDTAGPDDGAESDDDPDVPDLGDLDAPVPPSALDASVEFGVTASGEGDFLVPLDPPAEAAHARRTMIGRSAEEVDHAPPRGRYAPEQAPDTGGPGAALRWVAPAAALAIAGAVVVGRALRRRR
ncbi:SRPBCC domain-containing protein [Streptomyces sp. NPDC058595]|uniref:SRPBCC domain-containing protein n=1 Tax=Streptomyces sp. NPDC058595 TaxID=3346550 RepID=UPI00364DCB42